MEDKVFYLKVASTIAIIIPLLIGLRNIEAAGYKIRLFLLFLVAGLLVDLTMWYLIDQGRTGYLLYIFDLYSLIESVFYCWFIFQVAAFSTLRSISQVAMYGAAVSWFCFVFMGRFFSSEGNTFSTVFVTTYEIVVAFLSGFTLLGVIEARGSTSSPIFWILLGIFFYCFCTFFIMGFLNTIVSQHIWFLNNIINIIAYFFYSIGLWRLRRQPVL